MSPVNFSFWLVSGTFCGCGAYAFYRVSVQAALDLSRTMRADCDFFRLRVLRQ
jgi:hypothetical protein